MEESWRKMFLVDVVDVKKIFYVQENFLFFFFFF